MNYSDIAKITGTWLTVLINIVGFLIGLFLLWKSNKKEFQILQLMITSNKEILEDKINDTEKDIEKIWNKIDNNIVPDIAKLQTEIKKNCQAVLDIKDRCKDNHYGVMHSYQGKQ